MWWSVCERNPAKTSIIRAYSRRWSSLSESHSGHVGVVA